MPFRFRFDPYKFVMKKASDIDRIRLLLAVDAYDHPVIRKGIKEILQSQNPDGGFPERIGAPSSVISTLWVIEWLLQLGKDHTPSFHKAIKFIWNMQRADGSWSENPEIKLEEWVTWKSTKHGMPYLTAMAVQTLCSAGYEKDARIMRAVEYMKRTQLPNGHWPAHDDTRHPDPDASCVPALLRIGEPRDSPYVQKGINAMLKFLDTQDIENTNEAYGLGMVWPSLVEASVELDLILEKRLKKLREIQQEDGGWKTYFSSESHPGYTTTLLVNLIKAGALSKEEIKRELYYHCGSVKRV